MINRVYFQVLPYKGISASIYYLKCLLSSNCYLTSASMDDQRFAHVGRDPKFRSMPKKYRKVKIDKRFDAMFKVRMLYGV